MLLSKFQNLVVNQCKNAGEVKANARLQGLCRMFLQSDVSLLSVRTARFCAANCIQEFLVFRLSNVGSRHHVSSSQKCFEQFSPSVKKQTKKFTKTSFVQDLTSCQLKKKRMETENVYISVV